MPSLLLLRPSRCFATLSLLLAGMVPTAPAIAGDGIFDEMRFGTTASINNGDNREHGVFPSFTVFLDPLDADGAKDLGEQLLRPRIHAGAAIATSSEGANEVYGGLSWTFDVTKRFFVELGAGGTVHDGELHADGTLGPKLGCRLLFREYAAAGLRFDEHWNLSATVEHASHAELCDGPNDGLTRAGLALGYKF
ncbi:MULTISPECIES: acyloxyacyl hydrolase [unclassified Ensifer]|uniref:acyloxyacyl hydrolase n=1 Tax=unclassified Ensifer TaxID=2633371 RepID=UPI000AF27E9E|nr:MULTISPECIES: acyloxyacyl hydrolase [unclassified Ensifer]